jgi:demethylmenaquinone methyltransferase/2-methoxy-6-polyprenyl-1,4-benzoquinol methylase
MKNNLTAYYAQRAKEYDKFYLKPERQKDLKKLRKIITHLFLNNKVFEAACGTGYWTEVISKSASSILATDYNKEVIDIAKTRDYGNCVVKFLKSDAYSLSNITDIYSSGFLGFWWSHISKNKIDEFIKTFHSKLNDNALVVIIDSKYVEGNSTPISREDKEGNTYQLRKLEDGTEHEILKNFSTESELKKSLKQYSANIEFIDLDYYWILKYNVKTKREI